MVKKKVKDLVQKAEVVKSIEQKNDMSCFERHLVKDPISGLFFKVETYGAIMDTPSIDFYELHDKNEFDEATEPQESLNEMIDYCVRSAEDESQYTLIEYLLDLFEKFEEEITLHEYDIKEVNK
ncbi:hypothetical protein PSB64_001772 [Listeria monocytogenes]|nr:hypothetical protein [Listeria monocytogenes]